MEKSDHYYLKREYMKNLTVPTISEVKKELGEHLAEAFFSQCPDPLKPDMGLTPPLKGAGDDLWISPSDTLIGKVVLKPPLTNKHMKALTHQGILMIGYDVEIKFWNEAEVEKERALEELEEILTFMADVQKRQAVQDAHKEEWEICAHEKEQKRIEFEAKLQHELHQLQNRLKKEYDELTRLQKIQLEQQWQEKLAVAVAETVTRLTEKFLEDMAKQEEELLNKFSIEIKKEQIKGKLEVKLTQECCQETFKQLKHQLECKNIANMMYILCMERRKCQSEREYMEEAYQKQVQDMQAIVTEKEVEITRLTRDRDEKAKQIDLREECLLEILHQFQKFINFALRASPTQAEFLLNIEKLKIFELAQAVAKTHPQHGKRLAKKLLLWKADATSAASSRKSLIPEDHHSCYHELTPPVSEHSIKSNEYLAAFHYDKHMYVREEFRNMMSQGVKISPSNLIWNRDVENLMHVLRNSVTSIEEEQTQESEIFGESSQGPVYEERSPNDMISQQPRRSIVHFRKFKDDKNLLFPNFESDSSQLLTIDLHNDLLIEPKQDSISDIQTISEKDCCTRCTQTILKPLLNETVKSSSTVKSKNSGVPLIGTVNSLELHRESTPFYEFPALEFQKSRQETNQEAVGILSVKDSLIKHRMSLRPSSKIFKSRDSIIAPEVLELGRKSLDDSQSFGTTGSKDRKKSGYDDKDIKRPSKLSLTRDSYLVHKQSLILKRQQSTTSQDDGAASSRHFCLQNANQLRKSPKPTNINDTADRVSVKKSPKQSVNYKGKASPPGSTKLSVHKVSSTESLTTSRKLRAPRSKLSLSRDSLQLLRSQSKLSSGIRGKRRDESKESIEIKNSILGYHTQRLSPPISIKLDDDGLRAVKMSHIEILPLKQQHSHSIETKEEKTIISDANNLTTTDSPWIVYHDKKSSADFKQLRQLSHENFLTKPNVAQIMGDQKAHEHTLKDEDFTLHRATSMLSIFRKHPSLIRMFTACTK